MAKALKKMKWNKDGELEYAGVARHAEKGDFMLIYRDLGDIEKMRFNLVMEFDPKSFSQKGMPRNHRFDFIE